MHWYTLGRAIDQTRTTVLVFEGVGESIVGCSEIITVRCLLHGQLREFETVRHMAYLLFILFPVNKMFVVHRSILVFVQLILLDLVSGSVIVFSGLIGILLVIELIGSETEHRSRIVLQSWFGNLANPLSLFLFLVVYLVRVVIHVCERFLLLVSV